MTADGPVGARRGGRICPAMLLAAAVSVGVAVISDTAVGTAAQPGAAAPAADRASIAGTWNFSTLTPLERPQEFSGRASIGLAEAAEYERRIVERSNADRRDGPASLDVDRAYNELWFDRGTHLAVVDGQARTSLIVDPPDGRVPALTPDAARRQAARFQDRREHPADGPESRPLAERCLSFNAGPPMLPAPYNNYVQIFVFDRYVIILNEMIHDARIVPTDGRPHAPPQVRRFLGDSVGRWEGRTLVVDTTNFSGQTSLRGSSDRLHLVERFTRIDGDTLMYEFLVDDPAAFTRPWRAQLPMSRTDERIFEYACHEGNQSLGGILRGARQEERERQSAPR